MYLTAQLVVLAFGVDQWVIDNDSSIADIDCSSESIEIDPVHSGCSQFPQNKLPEIYRIHQREIDKSLIGKNEKPHTMLTRRQIIKTREHIHTERPAT